MEAKFSRFHARDLRLSHSVVSAVGGFQFAAQSLARVCRCLGGVSAQRGVSAHGTLVHGATRESQNGAPYRPRSTVVDGQRGSSSIRPISYAVAAAAAAEAATTAVSKNIRYFSIIDRSAASLRLNHAAYG